MKSGDSPPTSAYNNWGAIILSMFTGLSAAVYYTYIQSGPEKKITKINAPSFCNRDV